MGVVSKKESEHNKVGKNIWCTDCIKVMSPLTLSTMLGFRNYYCLNYMIGGIESQRAGFELKKLALEPILLTTTCYCLLQNVSAFSLSD